MKLLLLELHKKKLIQRYSDAISEFLTTFMKLDHRFYFDLISATDDNSDLFDTISSAFDESHIWRVDAVSHFSAVSKFLTHKEPKEISISINHKLSDSDVVKLRSLLTEMKDNFHGRLWLILLHSHEHFDPIDMDILLELRDTE